MIGHNKIWDFFKKAAELEKLAHGYLFYGPEGLGKKLFAQNLAKALLCKNKGKRTFGFCGQCRDCRAIDSCAHPDLFFLEPKEQSIIKIGRVREMQHQLSLSPHSSFYKIAIVNQAQAINKEAANALLKTLEEPSKRSLIILISAWPERMLSTVVSRCQKIRFSAVAKDELKKELTRLFPKKDINFIKEAVDLSFGRPGIAIKLLEDKELMAQQQKAQNDLLELYKMTIKERFDYAQKLSKDADKSTLALNAWILYLRDLLLVALGKQDLIVCAKEQKSPYSAAKLKGLIQKTEAARLLLANPGLNSRLILENLFLEF